MLYVISIITIWKGITIRSRITNRFSLRIILTCWLLAIVVLINAYKSVVISYLTIPKLKPIPQSLEELAAMKQYRITIMNNTLLANSILVLSTLCGFYLCNMSCIDFQNATSGTNKVLGDSLRQNPELLFTEFSQATKNVLESHAANVEVHKSISVNF